MEFNFIEFDTVLCSLHCQQLNALPESNSRAAHRENVALKEEIKR
jgi:hypothetical protein